MSGNSFAWYENEWCSRNLRQFLHTLAGVLRCTELWHAWAPRLLLSLCWGLGKLVGHSFPLFFFAFAMFARGGRNVDYDKRTGGFICVWRHLKAQVLIWKYMKLQGQGLKAHKGSRVWPEGTWNSHEAEAKPVWFCLVLGWETTWDFMYANLRSIVEQQWHINVKIINIKKIWALCLHPLISCLLSFHHSRLSYWISCYPSPAGPRCHPGHSQLIISIFCTVHIRLSACISSTVRPYGALAVNTFLAIQMQLWFY